MTIVWVPNTKRFWTKKKLRAAPVDVNKGEERGYSNNSGNKFMAGSLHKVAEEYYADHQTEANFRAAARAEALTVAQQKVELEEKIKADLAQRNGTIKEIAARHGVHPNRVTLLRYEVQMLK